MSTSRTVPGPGAGAPQLRHMWVSLVRQRWSALAVVAADGETPTAAVVDALRDVPVPRELGEFRILDARGATAADAERLQGDLAACAAGRVRTVVIVGPIADRMQAIPLTLLADAVLLVVRVGATHLAAARQTLELVGRDRLVGCVALHGDALLAQEPAPQAVPTLVAAKRDAPAASAERG